MAKTVKFKRKGKIANTILKNIVGRLILSDLKTSYEATVTKTMWHC